MAYGSGKKAKKKKSGSRKDSLKRMVKKGGGYRAEGKNQALRTKYGDLDPSDIYTGTASYRGVTILDRPSSSRTSYATAVRLGSGVGKKGFQFLGKLYRFTGTRSNDTTHERIRG